MKSKLLLGAMLLCGTLSFAQNADPVIMTINGTDVLRSEFEYSYNKNNTADVIDRKTVQEYVGMFINYKLKVEAAKEAGLDTMISFQKEFANYRDQQIKPALVTDQDLESEAQKIYEQTRQRIDNNGGMVQVAHILIAMRQQATPEEERAAKVRVDSIYQALRNGADFGSLAKQLSQDPTTAQKGGDLPYIVKGQTLKEFEDQAWRLQDGELSQPFLSPAGWHIMLKKSHRNFYSYADQREHIMKYLDQQRIRDRIATVKLDTLAKQLNSTPAQMLAKKQAEMEARDSSLKYLIKEYHDGLLLYEISNRHVWAKAQKDEHGLMQYFKKNKKKYKWEEPRFKGVAYRAREEKDIKAVRKLLKKTPFERWEEQLRTTFNTDSVLRIRAEKGIFKKGDNALVDHEVFKVHTLPKQIEGYPYSAVYGKKLKSPKVMDDVRPLVVTDYQEYLESQWVNDLRQKYTVTVNEDIVKTVNNH
ncbi:peptidylprolyl isomerase [Hallella colorans]|uniref:Peptidyl-prolyl cis-trans isomerase SurA n=1 Tax=Hallella colorans TaxID=1703337 RepID=A0A2U0UGZ0_9BACT|nr:peptidylprolyl isomerase [Hallella colorans]PVX56908.1 peptidyl-prolyl cis-trans isomerase SurA [Hallella colorans]